MTSPRYRLLETAATDIDQILLESARLFGPLQRIRYAQLLEAAADLIASQPHRPGSRDRDDLIPGLRSFHAGLSAHRRSAASHVFYYRVDEASEGIVIVRVLHDAMDPINHL